MRYVRAFIVGLCAFALLAPTALAQWPTTCVELNDIVEAHLGNDENVGIYQRVFGDQAEQACQNDHRDDVRSVFAWAIGSAPQPASTTQPAPVQPPSPTPAATDLWEYEIDTDPVTQTSEHIATNWSAGDVGILVRCLTDESTPFEIFVSWLYARIDGGSDNLARVEYRFHGSEPQSELWGTSGSKQAVFVRQSNIDSFAQELLTRPALTIRATSDETLKQYTVEIELDGGRDNPNHPIQRVMAACDR